MTRILVSVLFIAVVVIASSCDRLSRLRDSDICPESDGSHVCSVPFEILYSHRESLIGRNVRIDGIVVAGVVSEPPGSSMPVIMLFSSMERAKICNLGNAIELVPDSRDQAERLKALNGSVISIGGQVMASNKGHWAALAVSAPPSLVLEEHESISCLTQAPPPRPFR